MLEVGALRDHFAAARRIVAELEAALQELASRARRRDWSAVFEADMRLHTAIVRLHGSERIERVFVELYGELRLALVQVDRQHDDPEQLIADHRGLLEPIREGDRRAAVGKLREHLKGAARSLRGRLAALGAKETGKP